MLSQPRKTKYKKVFKGRIKGHENRANKVSFGDYGLKTLEKGIIHSREMESVRKVLSRKLRRQGKVHIRIFPQNPVSKKPLEIRMGKGKGPVNHWSARVKAGQVLFEIQGIKEALCETSLISASHKLSVSTKLVQTLA